jgi:hypothetical protein
MRKTVEDSRIRNVKLSFLEIMKQLVSCAVYSPLSPLSKLSNDKEISLLKVTLYIS